MNALGVQFRTAANNGDIPAMMELYKKPGLNITEAGGKSLKTAAHRAAEKGNVSVLRLLHNWEDPFTAVDEHGKTPSELALDPQCIKLFELIEQGKKAIEAARTVFPKKNHVSLSPTEFAYNKLSLGSFRAKLNIIVKKDIETKLDPIGKVVRKEEPLTKNRPSLMKSLGGWWNINDRVLSELIQNYHTIDQADVHNQTYAKCGELTAVAYAYLTTLFKSKMSVEIYHCDSLPGEKEKWDHSFLLLNRDMDYDFEDYKRWKEALVVDPLEERIIFFEYINAIKGELLIKKCINVVPQILQSTINYPYSFDGMKPLASEISVQQMKDDISAKTALRLSEVIDNRSKWNKEDIPNNNQLVDELLSCKESELIQKLSS